MKTCRGSRNKLYSFFASALVGDKVADFTPQTLHLRGKPAVPDEQQVDPILYSSKNKNSGLRRDEVVGHEEDYITGSFILCTASQILLG